MAGGPSNTLAVVLARAGSRGVPGKNSADVAGRPCVAWTIEHALRSEADETLVSSDSEEVLRVADLLGARTHRRPANLATDTARVDDALREAVRSHEAAHGPVGVVAMLYGNVPVRPDGLLDSALSLLSRSGCDSVQSYAGVGKHHPWWQARVDGEGRVAPWQGDRLFNGVYRRQDLPASHVPDGGVTVLTRRALFLEIPGVDPDHPHAFLGLDHRAVVNPEGAVIDIDSPIDLVVADTLLRRALPAPAASSAPA